MGKLISTYEIEGFYVMDSASLIEKLTADKAALADVTRRLEQAKRLQYSSKLNYPDGDANEAHDTNVRELTEQVTEKTESVKQLPGLIEIAKKNEKKQNLKGLVDYLESQAKKLNNEALIRARRIVKEQGHLDFVSLSNIRNQYQMLEQQKVNEVLDEIMDSIALLNLNERFINNYLLAWANTAEAVHSIAKDTEFVGLALHLVEIVEHKPEVAA